MRNRIGFNYINGAIVLVLAILLYYCGYVVGFKDAMKVRTPPWANWPDVTNATPQP